MTRIVAALVSWLVLGALVASAAAAPSPTTVPGWPKKVAAGRVLQGPAGGLLVVSQDGGERTVRAYRRDGRRLWTDVHVPGCGNCDDGPQPEERQPDGTWGPIGDEGDDYWAVDATGRRVRGCAGVVFADGSCVQGDNLLEPVSFDSVPVVAGYAPGASAPAWSLAPPGLLWADDFDVPPMSVRDAAGIVYVAFARPFDRGAAALLPGLLVAVDPAARAILWTRIGPTQALTGLRDGVLVAQEGGIAAYGSDGSVAWQRRLPAGQVVAPADAVSDARRGRIYIGRTGTASPGVTALAAATGRQAWRTRPIERVRLLSVGRGGRVYVAVDRPGRRAVRGLRLADGRTAWHRGTRARVLSARELVNGTVAVSAGERYGHGSDDRLTLLDPR